MQEMQISKLNFFFRLIKNFQLMGKCLSDDRIKCVHDLNAILILKFSKIHVWSLTPIGQLVKMDEKMLNE